MQRISIAPLLLLFAGCGDSAGSSASNSASNSGTQAETTAGECAIGFEGCPCSQKGSCLDDLVCVEGVCMGGGASASEAPTGSASESASAGTSGPITTTTSATQTSATQTATNSTGDSASTTMGVSNSDPSGTDTTGTSTGGVSDSGTGDESSSDSGGDPDTRGESSTGMGVVCGDGVAEGNEACDGADLDGETCVTHGFLYGQLGCTDACTADTSKCTNSAACSDGVLAPNTLCYESAKILTGTDLNPLVVGDFNEDGHLDLVGRMSDDPYVALTIFGNGDGTFKAQTVQSPGVLMLTKRAYDLDKDGHLDVIGTGPIGDPNKISVSHGDGTGKLTAGFDYDTPTSSGRFELVDVTGDGWLDLVNCGGTKTVRFRRGQPGGLFGPQVSYNGDPASNTGTCGFADIDADGFIDMFGGATQNFYWWHGDGDGNFVVDPVVTPIGVYWFAAVTHLDDDEYPDIIGYGNSGSELRVRLGSPMGFTGMTYVYPTVDQLYNYIDNDRMIGNFDGNDIPDIVVHTEDYADVFRGDGTGLFYDGVSLGYKIGDDIVDIALGDFNEDGLDDLVITYLVAAADLSTYIVLSDP